MNDKIVNIVVQEDKSVKRLLKKTSKKLRRSLKKSKLRLKEIKLKQQKKWWQKALTISLNFLSIAILLSATLICITSVANRARNIPPMFAGYSTLTIQSHSMENSGLYKGNSVIVTSVNTSELKKDDIIAFFVYNKTLEDIYLKDLNVISTEDIKTLKSQNTFKRFLGFQSRIINEAGKSNSILVIHHIKDIYKDEEGIVWFSTYGSSNEYTDEWLVRQDLVIGRLDNSTTAQLIASFIEFLTNPIGLFLFILIPLTYLIYCIITELLYICAIKKLQLQVLRGERRLTDIICVRNNVGYSLTHKKKLEVLATAPQELKTIYLSLLWENGSAPLAIKKHYMKKNILLGIHAEYNELERTIMLMYKDNVDNESIAKYYITQKNQIQQKESKYKRILKKIKLKIN